MFDRKAYIEQPSPIENELKLLFQSNEEIVIFEIGACEGEDSVKYSRLFPNSKIFAFEPLPANIDLIKFNIEKYDAKNVSYFNKALSSKEGIATFYVSHGRPKDVTSSDWDFGNKSSSLLPPEKHMELIDFIEFNEKIDVETTTLRAFCELNDISMIDFIHMDVQGAELMVLEGAGSLLKSIKCIWLEVANIELYKGQPLAKDIQRFMKKNNFRLVKNAIDGHAGDQLYVSKTYFNNYKELFPNQPKESKVRRLFKLLGVG